jgi:hypothetical protein
MFFADKSLRGTRRRGRLASLWLLRLRLASFGADGGPDLPHLALGGHLVYRSYKRKADASFIAGRCLLYSRAMSHRGCEVPQGLPKTSSLITCT